MEFLARRTTNAMSLSSTPCETWKVSRPSGSGSQMAGRNFWILCGMFR